MRDYAIPEGSQQRPSYRDQAQAAGFSPGEARRIAILMNDSAQSAYQDGHREGINDNRRQLIGVSFFALLTVYLLAHFCLRLIQFCKA